MQRINTLIDISFLLVCCNKNSQTDRCTANFDITSSFTPTTSTVAAGITTRVQGYGYNGCFQYAGSEVLQKPANTFEIRLKGTVPCEATVCTDLLVGAIDTIHISSPLPGTYYLKFYNAHLLARTDTVLVN